MWMTPAHLHSTDHGADGVFCDVVQPHLEGGDHHAGLQLAPGRQQQRVGAQPQLLLLAARLPRAERLRSEQRVLWLEAVLRGTERDIATRR